MRSKTKFEYLGNQRVGQQPAIFKKLFGVSNIATHFMAGTIELFKNVFKFFNCSSIQKLHANGSLFLK